MYMYMYMYNMYTVHKSICIYMYMYIEVWYWLKHVLHTQSDWLTPRAEGCLQPRELQFTDVFTTKVQVITAHAERVPYRSGLLGWFTVQSPVDLRQREPLIVKEVLYLEAEAQALEGIELHGHLHDLVQTHTQSAIPSGEVRGQISTIKRAYYTEEEPPSFPLSPSLYLPPLPHQHRSFQIHE